jgi:hypothetical protein
MQRLSRIIAWTEIAFPDLRLEVPVHGGDTDGIDALVFSWPVHLVGITTGRKDSAGASLFLEPAFSTNHLPVRGLGGVRVWGASRVGLAFVLEGGGIAGTDGHGAFAGAGPALGDRTGLIALVVRRYFILGADRWDFALDIRPSWTLADLIGG